ncbi:MAG TPA: phosphotransferase, partial [Xanthomonadaceae bacterium]|nr:phosphotransferase [Xanthomonadaceae bacterium]
MRRFLAAVMGLLLPAFVPVAVAQQARVIEGEITRADHQRYVEAPFEVPAGTARISVEFDYDKRGQGVTVDLGLLGPDGFRGWSGGNKRQFTIAAADATPSYLPGAIEPGRWRLLLGVPNVRPGLRSHYRARIELTPAAQADRLPEGLQPVLADTPG